LAEFSTGRGKDVIFFINGLRGAVVAVGYYLLFIA
jgi:hypothetical protein